MTTTTLTARRPEAAAIGWPRLLGRAGGAEWIKLRSVRSTYGSLVAAVIVTVGIAALAALAITGEFATGSIRTTLAATPARWAVLAAKAAVVGAVTLPTGLVATALATLAASAILGIGTDDILAVSARSAAALALISCWWWAWARSCAAPPAPSPPPSRSCSPRRSWVPWCPMRPSRPFWTTSRPG